MSDETGGSWTRDAELTPVKGVEHQLGVTQLGRKGVVAETLWKRDFPCVVHSASTEIETHGGEPGTCQSLGDRGEHAPVLESFEAVQNSHRRSGL
jgi:hypothetical protein